MRMPWKSRSMASTARPIFCSASAMIWAVMRVHLRRRLGRGRARDERPDRLAGRDARMLSGWLRSNTTIGRSFSMHRLTAVASITLSWSRSRSA